LLTITGVVTAWGLGGEIEILESLPLGEVWQWVSWGIVDKEQYLAVRFRL